MSSEIPLQDEELENLMQTLELETGVTSAPVSLPKEPQPTPSNEMFTADELLELESTLPEAVAEKQTAGASNLQAALAGLVSGADPVETKPEVSLEEELLAGIEVPETPAPAVVEEPQQVEVMAGNIKSASITDPAAMTISTAASATVATVATAPKPGGIFSAPLSFQVDPDEFKKETRVNPNDLDTCFVQQSSLRAYYNTQSANAESQAARIKLRFEIIEAKLYDEHRKTLAASSAKATEKMVENAVKTDPRWLAAKERLIDAETIASINKGLALSLADRRDMLIQLGANQRDEAKGQMRMAAAKDAADSLTQRALDSAQHALK